MTECPYKYIFGKPREGAHAIRIPILDWALVDTLMTILLAWFLAKYLKQPFWFILLVTFLIGEIFHAIFCLDSAFINQIKKIRLIIRNELRSLY
jgi:hypothetical protein